MHHTLARFYNIGTLRYPMVGDMMVVTPYTLCIVLVDRFCPLDRYLVPAYEHRINILAMQCFRHNNVCMHKIKNDAYERAMTTTALTGKRMQRKVTSWSTTSHAEESLSCTRGHCIGSFRTTTNFFSLPKPHDTSASRYAFAQDAFAQDAFGDM